MHAHGTAAAAIEALPKIAQQAGLESYTACIRQRIHTEFQAGAQA